MRYKIMFLLGGISLLFIKCTSQNNQINSKDFITAPQSNNQDTIYEESNSLVNDGFKVIHSFRNKNDSLIGLMFVHEIENNVYDSIVITDSSKDRTTFLYEIKWNKFLNKSGIDIVGKNDFYGYTVTLNNDYFTIVMIDNNKNEISDELLISWNKRLKHFEIFKT